MPGRQGPEAVRQRGWSYDFQLTIEYRYLKPPKHTTRHLGHHPDRKPVETTYGSFTDLRVNGSYLSVGDYRFDPIAEGTLHEHMDVDEDSSMDIDEDEDKMEVETATATYSP